jgi:hypothetical protein
VGRAFHRCVRVLICLCCHLATNAEGPRKQILPLGRRSLSKVVDLPTYPCSNPSLIAGLVKLELRLGFAVANDDLTRRVWQSRLGILR